MSCSLGFFAVGSLLVQDLLMVLSYKLSPQWRVISHKLEEGSVAYFALVVVSVESIDNRMPSGSFV